MKFSQFIKENQFLLNYQNEPYHLIKKEQDNLTLLKESDKSDKTNERNNNTRQH